MSRPIQTQVIERAFELVKNPETWTKGTLARDRAGVRCDVEYPHAVSFCSMGALHRAAWEIEGSHRTYEDLEIVLEIGKHPILGSFVKLLNDIGNDSIVAVNDRRGHVETVKVWEKAMERMKLYE